MIDVEIDLNALKKSVEGIGVAAVESIRSAAQAGAQVIYREVRLNAPVSEKAHLFYGSAAKKAPKGQKKSKAFLFQPGTLKNSIYQYYNKRLSTPEKAVYSISWNHQKAPYGFMVEYGTNGRPGKSFLRKSYDDVKDMAQKAAQQKLIETIKEKIK